MIHVLLFCAAFSLYDYAGFNATYKNQDRLVAYRVSQAAVQVMFTAMLWDKWGARDAIAFNVLWWTFFCDFLYYGWGYLLNIKGWENRETFRRGQTLNHVSWAHWTPLGLLLGGKTGREIPLSLLIGQSTVGLGISITILE